LRKVSTAPGTTREADGTGDRAFEITPTPTASNG
jgi:hypothetical protein